MDTPPRSYPSHYTCGDCGTGQPSGSKWCPVCLSTNLVFVDPGPEPGRVVELGAPRVVDDRPIWPDARKPPPISPNVVPVHEPIPKPMRSRWHAGASTFGPRIKILLTGLYAFYVVWGFLNEFFIYYAVFVGAGAFLMFFIWKKDEVDRSPTPWKQSIRETRDSFTRGYRERGRRAGAVVCIRCGGLRRAGESACYRCGSRRWTKTDATAATNVCGRCHSEWTEGARWCASCGAGATESIFVEPPEERGGRRRDRS